MRLIETSCELARLFKCSWCVRWRDRYVQSRRATGRILLRLRCLQSRRLTAHDWRASVLFQRRAMHIRNFTTCARLSQGVTTGLASLADAPSRWNATRSIAGTAAITRPRREKDLLYQRRATSPASKAHPIRESRQNLRVSSVVGFLPEPPPPPPLSRMRNSRMCSSSVHKEYMYCTPSVRKGSVSPITNCKFSSSNLYVERRAYTSCLLPILVVCPPCSLCIQCAHAALFTRRKTRIQANMASCWNTIALPHIVLMGNGGVCA